MMRQVRFQWTTRLGLPFALAAAATAQAGQGKAGPARAIEAMNRAPAAIPSAAPVEGVGNEYVIGPSDVLAIDVWHEQEISRVEPVRPDGKITLPLVGEIQASGATPKSLQAAITRRLSDFIHQPTVAVIVEQANSHRFNIIGEVLRPGSYPLGSQMTALDAVALAGGFGEFARTSRIYVVRRQPGGASARIPFNYKRAVRGDRRYLDLRLEPGDTVIVP